MLHNKLGVRCRIACNCRWLKLFSICQSFLSIYFSGEKFTLRSNVAKHLIEAGRTESVRRWSLLPFVQSFLTIFRAKPVFTAPFAFCNGIFCCVECRRGMNAFRSTNARGIPVFLGNSNIRYTRSNIRSSAGRFLNSLMWSVNRRS